MTLSYTTRFTAVLLAAAIVVAAWVPTVTAPQTSPSAALVAAIA
ncbi:MAG: hypothetical protein AB7P20_26570 [Rhizobiaceae bacterium]